MAHDAARALLMFSPYQSSTTVQAREGLVGVKKYDKRNQRVPTMPFLEVQSTPGVTVSWCLLWGSCICTYERDPQDDGLRFSVGAGLALYRPTYKEMILDTINSICKKVIYKKPFDIREDILYYQGNPLLSDCTIHHYGHLPDTGYITAWTQGYVADSGEPLPDKSNP